MPTFRIVSSGFAVLVLTWIFAPGAAAEPSAPLFLHDGWNVQSADKVQAKGEDISTAGYHPDGWLPATVPATVLATQVAAGVYKDPFNGTNLRDIPGTSYPIGQDYSTMDIPPDSPYNAAWWYRKEFGVPPPGKDRRVWLRFDGINYRANIWLNGRQIADSSQVAGTFRIYEFDITDKIVADKPNVIAVETFAPAKRDLGINWVDWNPCPPDKEMGLWRDVELATSGPVTLRWPMAATHFTDPSLQQANLTVCCELHNASDMAVHGTVAGVVAGVHIEQPADLQPHEDKTVVFDPETYKQLQIKKPAIWWPYQMGTPHLATLDLKFIENGKVSDEQSVPFGIREITSELTDKGFRLFRINGKPILIRGAGWSPDMMLREDLKRLRDQFALVRDMRLNTIRLEGKMETENFFRLADEEGVLIMAGWCCCDQWEQWRKWTPENYLVAKESVRSQILRLRHHASLLVWLNGSDNPPPADVERIYLDVETRAHWPNPVLSSASATPTDVTGQSGVKMTGPYDFVAPSYWYADKDKYGGAYGFITETGPGPAIPNISSLRKFLPADQIWPVTSAAWTFHNGGNDFMQLTVFNDAMKATYATPQSLEDYVRIGQTMAYNGERAMFEAYTRNKYTSTGVIQWMLNNAWPSTIWHLYDYYLDPDGGYYGTKKACEPFHVQYSYDDHGVVVVNSTYQASPPLTVTAKVYDFNLNELFHQKLELAVDADTSQPAISIPDSTFAAPAKVYFVDLTLAKKSGEIVSRNFYWVPAVPTSFDWDKTDYTHTPALRHEDMTQLASLPKAEVEAGIVVSAGAGNAGEKTIRLRLNNPSKALAFQLAVAVRDAHGDDIAPAPWSDNYVELMPGESRVLTATLPAKAVKGASVILSGWNIAEKTLSLSSAK